MDLKALYTTYQGRIPRSQYWIGFLILMVLSIAANLVLAMIGLESISVIVSIAILVVAFFLYIKRFHDLDKSGWFSLLMLIPFVNLAVGFIWLGFIKGTGGANQYGPDPLAGSAE